MLGNYYYHEIIRRTIVSFGTLFNNIHIKHNDDNQNDVSLIKVPIAYGPVQKFLARLDEKPDLRKKVAITLPRMSFEMTSIQYDPERKVSSVQTFQSNRSGVGPVKVYMPAPYNIGIQLSIITKYQDDMLQIVEQILPFFQPNFNLTVDLVNSIGEKRDIPIILESINMSDDYEGDFSTRRSLVYTLNFTAKTSFFGPISDSSDALIKKVQVDYYANTETTRNASRQLRYTVEPRAIKDYNNDATTTLAQEVSEVITEFNISDSSALQEDIYIMINQESMFIKEINGNRLKVLRAQDNTIAAIHEEGDVINIINSQDDELIELGDEFGFDENYFDFGDGRVYSPRKDVDV
jgi:hypothetical protein